MTIRIRLVATAAAIATAFAATSAFAWAPDPVQRGHRYGTCRHQDCKCQHHAKAVARATWRA